MGGGLIWESPPLTDQSDTFIREALDPSVECNHLCEFVGIDIVLSTGACEGGSEPYKIGLNWGEFQKIKTHKYS